MKITEAMERFERGMREERKALATRQTYRSHVGQFLGFSKNTTGTVEERVSEFLPLHRLSA